MSDVEEEVAAPVEVVDEGPMDLNRAIQEVLKQAKRAGGLSRGIGETTQALDRRAAHLCLLATDLDDANISKLIEALCQEHGIRLLKVDSRKTLGEWCGLCKYDQEGNARRVVSCAAVAVTDYGETDTPTAVNAHALIEEHFKG